MTDEELLRYSRHIFLAQIDISGQQKINNAKVLIVGLGGLGSTAALYLAASGVGELHIADFDKVEFSNLQRQIIHNTNSINTNKAISAKTQLTKLNPNIKIIAHSAKLTANKLKQITNNCNVILDCTDNFTARDAINYACVTNAKPLISAAAIGISGQLSTFDLRSNFNPCYNCLFTGNNENLTCSEAGVLGPMVGMLGAMQALEALKIIANFGTPLVGKLLCFDALTCNMRKLKFSKNPNCAVCGAN